MRLEDTLDLPVTGFDEDKGGNGKAEFIFLKQKSHLCTPEII